jgi:hypothetical protein
VVSAEAAYHAANSAFYGSISCLQAPSGCIANYPPAGPSFLDALIASLTTKSGYARTFTFDAMNVNGITGAVNVYCYQGSPQSIQGGVRSFAGDSSGIIYAANSTVDCCLPTGLADAAACGVLR